MSGTGNVFLIGPMGVGKTTIGRHLAELLRKEFGDCDQEIEARTGASIALIFDVEGEPGFRRRESSVLEELTQRHNLVLATGGGAVLAEENRRALRERGLVVYLHAPLETLLSRTRRDRERPLLQTPDRRAALQTILEAREPIYRDLAAVVVETAQRSPRRVAQEIADRLHALESREDAAS